ncbi:hypothetical protein DAI22_01g060208 [Oryza sativa Japonica Group]|nr:hypothetical protein DAI22_01g060208 [Oryza sativa Japonica Group]
MLEIYPQSHRRPLTAEYTLILHASEEAGAVINTSILSCSTPHSDESRARRRRAPKPWARGSGQTGGSECASQIKDTDSSSEIAQASIRAGAEARGERRVERGVTPCKAVAVTGEATTTRYVAAPKADLASSIRRRLWQRMRKRRWRLTSFLSPFSCRRARRRPRSKPRNSLTERERSLSVSSQRRKTAGWRRRRGEGSPPISPSPAVQAVKLVGAPARRVGPSVGGENKGSAARKERGSAAGRETDGDG